MLTMNRMEKKKQQREKGRNQRDRFIRSPVKETIELDTKFVRTHARVICVTRHRKLNKNNNNSNSKYRCVFSRTNGFVDRSSLLVRLKDMQQVHTVVVGLSLLSLLFCCFCSSFSVFLLLCAHCVV